MAALAEHTKPDMQGISQPQTVEYPNIQSAVQTAINADIIEESASRSTVQKPDHSTHIEVEEHSYDYYDSDLDSSDVDEGEEEEDTIGYGHEDTRVLPASSHHSAAKSEQPREPSPSDAAMPRPRTQCTLSPTFVDREGQSSFGQPYSRFDSKETTRSLNLSMSDLGVNPYLYSFNPPFGNYSVDNHYRPPPLSWYNPQPPSTSLPPLQEVCGNAYSGLTGQVIDHNTMTQQNIPRPTFHNKVTPADNLWHGPPTILSAPVATTMSASIDSSDSIPPLATQPAVSLAGTKRKVEEISETHQSKDILHEIPEESAVDPSAIVVVPAPEIPETAVEEPLPANSAVEEPSPKRAKLNDNFSAPRERTATKGIVKYAATALAGVAVGAVGTIFGLAALPADYFA